jgi:hypothetical protein
MGIFGVSLSYRVYVSLSGKGAILEFLLLLYLWCALIPGLRTLSFVVPISTLSNGPRSLVERDNDESILLPQHRQQRTGE